MKRSVALVLQVFVVLLGLAALAFLLGEPHVEGRNAHATVFEIYCQDPFLAYVYVGSIPFFVGLRRAFGLLGQVRREGSFSPATVSALRSIRRCALLQLGFVAGGLVIVVLAGDPDDRPAGIAMGLIIALATGAAAATASLAARKLQASLARNAD